jgi:hypothetical protein
MARKLILGAWVLFAIGQAVVPVNAQTGNPYYNVMSYGAKCDGSTDDTSAIQSALNAAKTSSGTVFIPDGLTCVVATSTSPALSLDQFTGVAFTCGLPSAKHNPGGSLLDQCVLKFTGTPAILLSTRSSLGVNINGILLFASNASFNGTMLDSSHTGTGCGGSGCDTEELLLSHNVFHGENGSCAVAVSLDKTISSTVEGNSFFGCGIQLRGAAASNSYCNVNRYLHNTFSGTSNVTNFIENPGHSSEIDNNTFEDNNRGIPVTADVGGFISGGVRFVSNWVGDGTTSKTYDVLSFGGEGNEVSGNSLQLVASNATLLSLGTGVGTFSYFGNTLCGATYRTLFSILAASAPDVNISQGTCVGLSFATFLSGTPASGLVTDTTGKTTIYGNVFVDGTLSKSGGGFRIDHPLDPANKFLSHSFVESPDMMNVYSGTVILGDDGGASVKLPDYFEALNRDFRYQLTSIGEFVPVYVAREIVANSFVIAGGKPGVKVSWQVTGVRHDAYANSHRITVEEQKSAEERTHFLDQNAPARSH